MKDGLVIPQPILVNDNTDDDEGGAMVVVDTQENGVGGSRKRSREEDLQEQRWEDLQQQQGDAAGTPSKSWVPLTDQQRNKRRLLASPRKMASVQDFFAEPSPSVLSNHTGLPAQPRDDHE
ncbi:hypothetical protein BGZ65_012053, partial [Modicella reniformis]